MPIKFIIRLQNKFIGFVVFSTKPIDFYYFICYTMFCIILLGVESLVHPWIFCDDMNILLSVDNGGLAASWSAFFASVRTAFMQFGLLDLLDILLLSAMFFLLVRFLSNRKAAALLIGVAICVVVLGVAKALGLVGTQYVLSSLFSVGVLALLVIFQPEIRNALEKLGTGSIKGIMSLSERRKKNQAYYNAIENITTAVDDLAKTRTGALIVLSRTTKLDEIASSGIYIDADVNSFLIRNIFFNKAPLHDGAIIIDDARILSAGCLLPLTRRSDVEADLGTRHRAAIGMSEMSDAVIIVVSEETGTISVAHDCQLVRNYTPESLKSFLIKKIIIGRPAKDSNVKYGAKK